MTPYEKRHIQITQARERAAKLEGPKRPKEDILNGLWDMYLENCELLCEKEGLDSVRLPDMERALAQIEKDGLPAN